MAFNSVLGQTTIQGNVSDALFKKGVDSVSVQLIQVDSSLVRKTFTYDDKGSTGRGCYYFHDIPSGKYVLQFSREGYKEEYLDINIKKNVRFFGVQTVLLHHQIKSNDIMLGTATVKASLVKMVVDNDTIVYNAGAFQLAEGSMLDGLIRQLPGAEIRDNQIYVNGEFVQSLLVNGKDFFKGDPAIALENLPAYMVNKIKVFRRETEEQQASGIKISEDEKELVMDVRLKREYNTGWVANVQGGIGTDDRWLARLFGLRFTTNSRFAIYGNMNNTNDNRQPSENTDWKQNFIYDGISSRKKGGAMWSLDIPKQKMNLGLELHAEHKDVHAENNNSSVRFLQEGNTWLRSHSVGKHKENDIRVAGNFSWINNPFGNMALFRFSPKAEFFNQERDSYLRQMNLDREPYENYRGAAIDSIFLYGGSSALQQSVINTVENTGRGDRDRFRTSGYWYASPGLPIKNTNLFWEGNYSYENNKENNYSIYNLSYPNKENVDVFHHNYINQHNKKYDYDIKTYLVSYIELSKLRTLYGCIFHTYKQQYTNNARDRYLLEKLPDWSRGLGKALTDLPSTRDEMEMAIDAENSYYSTLRNCVNIFDLCTSYQVQKDVGNAEKHHYIDAFRVDFHFPIRLQTDRLNYDRSILNVRDRRRHLTFFEPNASIEISGYKLSWSLSHDAPDMLYLLPIRDDTDPLNVHIGNESLKDIHNHNVSLRKEWKNNKTNRVSSASIDWRIMQNAIAMGRTYDSQTGVTTYQPDNVNGNWNISANYRLNRPLDKNKRLFLSNATTVSYANSVDLISTDQPYTVRSSVRNTNASEELSLSYKIKQYSFGGRFGVNWINAHSDRANFETVNCENWIIGANAVIPLPWKMQLAADFSTTLRTGYNDHNMNEAAFVCNARLSRSFFHGKLTMILDGFDIFNGIKDIRRTINEQGRTETWYNSVHRYVMLHAFYKFAKKPKK